MLEFIVLGVVVGTSVVCGVVAVSHCRVPAVGRNPLRIPWRPTRLLIR
jgi:hypothetical protein